MTEYYDLGSYGRTVTTRSADAQLWFDRGLVWCFGYHHEEAIECFEKALEHDPDCAMAHWGIAYSVGPNYNKPWIMFDENDMKQSLGRAYEETQAALACASKATPVEQALIDALPARYPQPDPIEDCRPWNDDFANTMRKVFRAYRDDLDVRTFFVESIMNRTPWKLWDLKTGDYAEGAGTEEAMEVMDEVFSGPQADDAYSHPGLLHLHIHMLEMSPFPEKALKTSDALRDLVPDAGHLRHMPTHIDVLCGNYHAVVDGNRKAIEADRHFLAEKGPMNFYTAYRVHNYHFEMYGAMFLGQFKPAIRAAEELMETVPEDLLRVPSPPMADWLEGYFSMKQHVLVRFGKWQEIIDQDLPEDRDLYCVTTAMIHYAKAVAHAASGNVPAAEEERLNFQAAKEKVPDTRYIHINTCQDILGVAEAMLEGELEYRKGNHDQAFAHLREAVARDDALPYDEPWGWMQPPRHALGALLLEQGRVDEAEAAYRADLGIDGTLNRSSQNPDNLWSLHGLHECLVRRGETDEAVIIKQRLDLAAARADGPIKASCFCRLQHAA
ncbi:MAG: tetratricopeptide repeat protein [Pseudomonadota bacterium]